LANIIASMPGRWNLSYCN